MHDERPEPGDELDEDTHGKPTDDLMELGDAVLADPDDDAAEALAREDLDGIDGEDSLELQVEDESDDEARGFFEEDTGEEEEGSRGSSPEWDPSHHDNETEAPDDEAGTASGYVDGDEVTIQEDELGFGPKAGGAGDDEGDAEGTTEATGTKVDVTVRNTKTNGNLKVVGVETTTINNINRRDKGRFLSVERQEWLEVEPIFVPSADCAAHVAAGDAFAHGPVLILCGEAGTGKRTGALYLAEHSGHLEPTATSTYRYHPPTDSEVPSLVEVLSDRETPSAALLIFENAFESRNAERELTGSSLAALLGLLNKGFRRLLLTTSRQRQDLPDTVEVLSAELDAKRLETLRGRALEHRWPRGGPLSGDAKKLILDNWESLATILDRSGRIHDFIRLVAAAKADKVMTPELIKALAEEMVTPRPWGLSQWFSDLDANELLLAFLICFFADLLAADLLGLYAQSAHWLRQDGVQILQDPRGRGVDDMLFRLKTRPRANPLVFDVQGRIDFVGQQVANHRYLLLSLAELLLHHFDGLPGRDGWPLRKGIGTLIGHLGVSDPSWMQARLVPLAQHSRWQQNTVASYALTRFAEEDLRAPTERSLAIAGRWAKGGPQLRWTSGASLWRIFELVESRRSTSSPVQVQRLQTGVVELLRRIVIKSWDGPVIREARNQVLAKPRKTNLTEPQMRWKVKQLLFGWRAYPVIHALVRCLNANPEVLAPHFVNWLSGGKEDLRNVAWLATEEALRHPSPLLAGIFGQLAMAFLASAAPSNQTLQRVFRRLQGWMDRKELVADLFHGLLTVCRDGGELRRGRLRRVLAETWTDTPEARALAARLVARSHALDGRFVAPLELGRALLVYDPAIAVDWRRPVLRADGDEPGAKQEESEARVVRQLASLLAARFELRLGVLGRVRTWTLDEPLRPLLQCGSRFPLLLPVLEEAASWSPDLTVVVCRGLVIDLEDLEGHPASDRLIRVSVTEPDPEEEAPPDWYLAGGLTERRLEELEEVLEERWTTAQREAPAAAWEPLTKRLGIDTEMTAEEREAALREACRLLPDPAAAGGPDDLVRCLSGAFMAWTAHDLPTAIDVLARWLDPGSVAVDGKPEDGGDPSLSSGETPALSNESRVAAAVSKALYRLHRGSALEPGDDHSLLFDRLAWPLSVADQDGVATVLRAVEGWLADPGWSEHLAGHDADGGGAGSHGRLVRWAERFLPGRAKELAELLPSRPANEPEGELLSDLLQTLAGGPTYRQWPALLPGQRRGLVVPDSLSPSGAGGLALRLARRVQQDSPETVPTIVRLGEVRPIWVPGAQAWSEVDKASPPRLLVPLLECAEVDPDSVAFVVVLTSGPILDEADLLRSPWWPKIQVVPLAASQEPQDLRWLTPDAAVVVEMLHKAEELLFEMLMDGLDRGGPTAAAPAVGGELTDLDFWRR